MNSIGDHSFLWISRSSCS